jgi:hypothetical protein
MPLGGYMTNFRPLGKWPFGTFIVIWPDDGHLVSWWPIGYYASVLPLGRLVDT